MMKQSKLQVKQRYHLNIFQRNFFFFLVEGKGSKKEKAKEDAAAEMIRLIIKEQNANTLPSQFKPFDEQE